jgi:hypothetical protein
VFDPNACGGACPHDLGRFINDLIVRTARRRPAQRAAGVPQDRLPRPQAMEELVSYDPHLVAGILGGSSGTTHDAFKLLEEAKKYGAAAALFGARSTTASTSSRSSRYLHAIANGQIKAEKPCRAYHGELQKLKLKPYRDLKADMELTTTATATPGRAAACRCGACEAKHRPRACAARARSRSVAPASPAAAAARPSESAADGATSR